MEFQKETIIELRQLNSKSVIQNGDYENIIEDNNLVINEGDRLTLKKAVIDSLNTQNNEIVISEDVNGEISFFTVLCQFYGKKQKRR